MIKAVDTNSSNNLILFKAGFMVEETFLFQMMYEATQKNALHQSYRTFIRTFWAYLVSVIAAMLLQYLTSPTNTS